MTPSVFLGQKGNLVGEPIRMVFVNKWRSYIRRFPAFLLPQRVKQLVLTTYDTMRPGVTVFGGQEKKTGEMMRICHAGVAPRNNKLVFPPQILSSINEEIWLGRRWLWQIHNAAVKSDCSFLLVESPALLKSIIIRFVGGRLTAFFLPFFVKTHVQVDDIEALLYQNEHLENDLRRLKHEGFSLSVSTAPEDYQLFLEEYYQPYVKRAHGSFAWIYNYEFLCRSNEFAHRYWELLKVRVDDDWLAGMLIRKTESGADAMEIGVMDGDYQLVKRGVLAAAYWFFVQRARELGYSTISFMTTPPFLMNGVLQFKSKYRPWLSATPSNTFGVLFMPLKKDSCTQRILLDQPFFQLDGNGLKIIAFAKNSDAVEKVLKTVRKNIRRFRTTLPVEVIVINDYFAHIQESK